MDRNTAISELRLLIDENEHKILPTKWYPEGLIGAPYYVNKEAYDGWHTKTLTLLRVILPENNDFLEKLISYNEHKYSNAMSSKVVLENLIEVIEKGYFGLKDETKNNTDQVLETLFERFYKVARQLRSRYDNRPTIDVKDEYDVQDLLHALLKIYFDDVRPEEWTPSYAGKSARMDFLLKDERVVIEVKKTRRGLSEKELGDQLIVDADRYKEHPDCKKLMCFVYDPEGLIGNPVGLSYDLNNRHEGFVKVIIKPEL